MSVAWNAFKQGQAIIKSSEKCVSRSWRRHSQQAAGREKERERAGKVSNAGTQLN